MSPDMRDTAILLEEIRSLPPDLAAEALDFVGYLKHKRGEAPPSGTAAPGLGKAAALPRFTREQIEAAVHSPDIQELIGAIPSAGLPLDITAKDIREMRLKEKYGI